MADADLSPHSRDKQQLGRRHFLGRHRKTAIGKLLQTAFEEGEKDCEIPQRLERLLEEID